jgi:gamma-glutamyltranspeptidase/glutathione hydrolase
MTPTILLEGGETGSLVLGSPGGPRLITAVIGVCLRVLVYGERLEAAVSAPRFHQQWSPQLTEFEPGWPPAMLEALRRRGHEVGEVEARFGGVQAIRVLPNGEVVGVSDPRRLGAAAATDDGPRE